MCVWKSRKWHRSQVLTQSNCVIDAKAAKNFLYVSGMKETVPLDDHLEGFWRWIQLTNEIISFVD